MTAAPAAGCWSPSGSRNAVTCTNTGHHRTGNQKSSTVKEPKMIQPVDPNQSVDAQIKHLIALGDTAEQVTETILAASGYQDTPLGVFARPVILRRARAVHQKRQRRSDPDRLKVRYVKPLAERDQDRGERP